MAPEQSAGQVGAFKISIDLSPLRVCYTDDNFRKRRGRFHQVSTPRFPLISSGH
jgi:hypothetical protein